MNIGKKLSKEQAMALALDQAKQGLGRVSPNPPVGAVILDRNNQCLSVGYHRARGMDHAEVMALNQIQNFLEGAVMYTTLEPCSMQGLTPSCAKRIAQLPFSKICCGLKDPNPKVNGNGIEIIKAAGIKVEVYQGPLLTKLRELIEIYEYNLKYKKPFVGVKIASSLDGHITSGKRRWITGESSRHYVSLLRGYYDAVCIGVNTLLKDNPRLNSRHPDFMDQKNYVVVLDPEGQSFDFLRHSNLLKVREPSKVIIVSQSRKKSPYVVLEQEINYKGQFDLDFLLKELFKRGIRSLLVEGGEQVFSSFLKQFQRIYLFLAPLLIGQSSKNVSWTKSLTLEEMLLVDVKQLPLGQDVLITGRNPVLKSDSD